MKEIKTHWIAGAIYLVVLAPLFFALYGWGNDYASHLPTEKVGEIVYAWERHIPFCPWTIVPYWSIDLLYGLSLFLPMTHFALRQHALRLLLATPLAVAFFYFFPLTFTTPRPETYGLWKVLFDALMGFDKPFNQAPSLHIVLLVILWFIYLPHIKPAWARWTFNAWFTLIGLSVLTTFQHHFIDIPTGFAVGVLICYLLPVDASLRWRPNGLKSGTIGFMYLGLAALFAVIPLLFDSVFLYLLWWPAISGIVVVLGYWVLGSSIFQKKTDGSVSNASWWIILPYRLLTQLIRHTFFKTQGIEREIEQGVYLGPAWIAMQTTCTSILDLCAEYQGHYPPTTAYVSIPILDLAPADLHELTQAVHTLDRLHQLHGTVFVHCALGVSRSVTVVLAWLIYAKHAHSIHEAQTLLARKHYHSSLSTKHFILLNRWVTYCKKE